MSAEHFNKLTPDEDERLAYLLEECGEVLQCIGKIQRHGFESFHPNDPQRITNRGLLRSEVFDLIAVIKMIEADLGAFPAMHGAIIADVITKKMRYAHHQR